MLRVRREHHSVLPPTVGVDLMSEEQKHPDITWARAVVVAAKGDRVSEEELETMCWDGLMGCYLMRWAGMTLGIETDGHMHT